MVLNASELLQRFTAALLFDSKADRLHILSRPDCLSVAEAAEARALRLFLIQLKDEAGTRPGSAILEELESEELESLSNTVRITNRVPVDADALGAALGEVLAWRADRPPR